MSCEVCQALREEREFLREQVKTLQNQLLAATSPMAHAQINGKLPSATMQAAVESFVDDHGEAWVTLNGRSVKLAEYQKLMEGGGYATSTGEVIPVDEWQRAQSKLDEMMKGGQAQ